MASRAIVEGFRVGIENYKKYLEKEAKRGDEIAKVMLEGWNESEQKQ